MKKKVKIFLYRKWSKKFTFRNFSSSDFKFLLEDDLAKEIKIENKEKIFKLDLNERNDVIKRCQLLKSLKKDDANHEINIVLTNIYFLFNKYSIKEVFTTAIDNYILHILNIICKKQKINFWGYISTPMPGYFRITDFGEIVPINNKIKRINEKDIKDFYQSKLRPSHFIDAKNFNYLLFKIKMHFSKIYFLFIHKNTYHRKLNFLAHSRKNSHFTIKKLSDKRKKNINVFVPLQTSPESTIDYHTDIMLKFHTYEDFLFDLFSKHKKINFFIKEHNFMVYGREKSFIEKISNLENVSILPLKSSVYDLIKLNDFTFSLNGTPGIECLMLNKPLLTVFNGPFYCKSMEFLELDKGSLKGLRIYEPTKKNINQLCLNISSSFIPGSFRLKRRLNQFIFDEKLAKLFAVNLLNLK